MGEEKGKRSVHSALKADQASFCLLSVVQFGGVHVVRVEGGVWGRSYTVEKSEFGERKREGEGEVVSSEAATDPGDVER